MSLAEAPQRPTSSGLAIVSLVCGVAQFFLIFVPCGLVTIPLAVSALTQNDGKEKGKGRRLAIAGLVLSLTHFAIYVALVIWLIAASG